MRINPFVLHLLNLFDADCPPMLQGEVESAERYAEYLEKLVLEKQQEIDKLEHVFEMQWR